MLSVRLLFDSISLCGFYFTVRLTPTAETMKKILQLKVKVFLTGCDFLNSFIQCPKGIYRNNTTTEN